MMYVVPQQFLQVYGSTTITYKWRARREVVDWLNHLVSRNQSHRAGNYVSFYCNLILIVFDDLFIVCGWKFMWWFIFAIWMVVCLLLGISCALVRCYIVLLRMSFTLERFLSSLWCMNCICICWLQNNFPWGFMITFIVDPCKGFHFVCGYVMTIDIVQHLWTSKALYVVVTIAVTKDSTRFNVGCSLSSNTSLRFGFGCWFMSAYFKVVFCTFYWCHGVCQFSHSLLTTRDKMISEMWVFWLFVDLIGLFFEIV
jgi:hypothetical protein